ncbi:Dihydrosphingosine phosphate lyase [Tieghemiomyces parasiticus]|uniref:sphinganine-1-phosphate aldolase n=1 Tax=Tieghemiomyces parasiticus TaxID=78921 RepID=A0A9W8A8D3_9FUNG|nr:Dihydrosphingosine phosphate lyase [Tieghemiomyces parasiticus]
MANVSSTSAGGYLMSLINWRAFGSYAWAHPRRAFLTAVGSYYVCRQVVSALRQVAVRGLTATLVGLYRHTAHALVRGVRVIPGANASIRGQVDQVLAELETQVAPDLPGEPRFRALPAASLSTDEVLAALHRRSELDDKWQSGRVSGTVYHGGEELNRLLTQAFGLFAVTNPLHPDTFPGLRRMEAEVVAMVLRMFNAPEEAVGVTTSGGTESILLAVRAHLNYARQTRGVTDPELVVPTSAHAAFNKAADLMGIRLISVPIDADTKRVNLTRMRRAISRNTIMIVGSAPNFPHGIIDDLEALSALAVKHKIGFHVDSCLGGFLIPFMEQAGYPLPLFDFRLPGVTSISCDTHKYGFAPKGSSVVMYRHNALRRAQYFVVPDWQGGIYATPNLSGSRPGALIAACWAAMVKTGEAGYVASARQIVEATRRAKAGIAAIPELCLMGDPLVSVVAFRAYTPVSIYGVNDVMHAKGWNLNVLQYPSCVHFCFTLPSAPLADQFVVDLRAAVDEVLANPNQYTQGSAAVYGMATTLPDRSIVDDIAAGFVDCLYKV